MSASCCADNNNNGGSTTTNNNNNGPPVRKSISPFPSLRACTDVIHPAAAHRNLHPCGAEESVCMPPFPLRVHASMYEASPAAVHDVRRRYLKRQGQTPSAMYICS